MQHSPLGRPHSNPLIDGRRRSLDMSGFNMGVALDKFGDMRLEVTRLNGELQTVLGERDSFRDQLDRTQAELLHTMDLHNDALIAKEAIEHSFEPTSKESKKLKTENEYVRKEWIRLDKIIDSRDAEIRKLKTKSNEQDAKIEKHKVIQQEALDHLEAKLRREKEAVERQLREANKATSAEKSKNDKLKSEKKTLEKTISNLETALKESQRDVSELEITKKSQKTSIDFLEGELARETITRDERNSDVRKAQESAFKMMMEPAIWMPKADTDIRRSLDRLGEDLWSWTKSCVRKDIDPKLLRGDVAQRMLRRISQVTGGKYYFNLEDPRHCAKLPALICISAITSLLYARLFKNPFFWQMSATTHTDNDISRDTYQVYIDAMEVDEKGANEWRCQMLRTFDPHIANDEQTDTDSKPEKCRSAAVQSFINEFLSSDANMFLNLNAISNEARLKQLVAIATKATRLSYHLWTHKTRLSILNLEDLNLEDEGGVIRYENGAELLQHHAYHNVELSRDDRCLDGKPIALITHPAIIAYGDPSGEHYGEYKVWKKAEAWMG
ncbi:hypothetical protein K505DRAFT_104075 [Melanomma pulvis-pyrius CBS 109.77]|uniref:Uncharacterized protein n=1 Tax=Melanomma pulvis-pyrius CBS 109.77 TaxID=1314802 RepID=A0A6A6WXN4_9PLEO|nr:hypothetical protein K505DRAFT_104075 [Melanomma pulvis-pyrius CBS 109.77]